MIAERTINEVRDLPIETVVGKYLTLKKAGASYTACCPFHDEKSPSFNVNPAKGFYKCFGCGASGDGIAFVMEKTGKEFADAIETIANDNGIEIIREKLTEAVQQKIDAGKNLMKVLHKTNVRYTQELSNNLKAKSEATPHVKVNQPLHDYIFGARKLTGDTLQKFNVGFASDWNLITKTAHERGVILDCTKAGIVTNNSGKSYDTFHHRLTIPICNVHGQAISFGGRALPFTGFDKPKYINGAETPVYVKGETLFGLQHALPALRKSKHALLVEGYLDVMMQHQIGNTNCVGTLGTALTAEQAKLLSRYASHVTIMRDGDKAGRAATVKDIDILAAEGFGISVIQLPEGEDPDSFPHHPAYFDFFYTEKGFIEDAIQWRLEQFFEGITSPNEKAKQIKVTVQWLIEKEIGELERSIYIQELRKKFTIKEKDFKDEITRQEKELQRIEEEEEAEKSTLPAWVTGELRESLFDTGFVQLYEHKKPNYKPGIYFGYNREDFRRLTNYCIKPLYFIMDLGNERRLVEIYNGKREAVIELGKKSMIEQGAFETDIASRPGFWTENGFTKLHFKTLVNWVNGNTKTVYELKSLGWQPEGFFAFSNMALKDKNTLPYDEYGIVSIEDRSFLSPGVSKLQQDVRVDDNIYENDLYLKFVIAPVTLTEYLNLFHRVYEDDGKVGIAFIFITAFLDIVSSVCKRPIFYCFGPKDSGKSALAESIMWLFFSGKNSDGKLIQGYNLNPGQGTIYSFFSRVQRFSNCPMLFNEYDPNTAEPWKRGSFKSYYDGEGREVGAGDTGKKRKTEIQKWKVAPMVVGQYLDIGDEGAMASRSIACRFSAEKNKARTDDQKALWNSLHELEEKGLSSLVSELFKHRQHVKEHLKKNYWEIQPKLNALFKTEHNIILEARLLNNYTLCLAMIKTLEHQMQLPFTFTEFETSMHRRLKMHQEMLRDNSVLKSFWREVEILFDERQLHSNYQLKVEEGESLRLKQTEGLIEKMNNYGYRNSTTDDVDVINFFPRIRKKFLYIRFDSIYSKYAKAFYDKHKKTAPVDDTIISLLKDQSYFLGLAKAVYFKDKTTSAYVLDYEALGVSLEKSFGHDSNEPNNETTADENDLPFKGTKQ